jgi:DNA-binding response OmpR family regulator
LPRKRRQPCTPESPSRPAILVTDDDESVRTLLERGLARRGFDVHLAGNGREALQLYEQQRDRIGLVLLDVCMPGLDGPETLKALRKLDPALRCCFISGHSGAYSEEQLLSMGIDYYFKKPFSLPELAAKLKEILGS